MAAVLKIEKSRYVMMMQNGSAKCFSDPPSWTFKIILIAGAIENPFCKIFAKFRGNRSYRCRENAIFRDCFFYSEM